MQMKKSMTIHLYYMLFQTEDTINHREPVDIYYPNIALNYLF